MHGAVDGAPGQQSAADTSATYHLPMSFSKDDPASAPADAPVPRRGRVGHFLDQVVTFVAELAEFRRHERPSIDGTPCVRCTAKAVQIAANAIALETYLKGIAEVIAPEIVRHARDADCPLVKIGDCDVCQMTVEVYGQDGCAVGVNHRVMNIRPQRRAKPITERS